MTVYINVLYNCFFIIELVLILCIYVKSQNNVIFKVSEATRKAVAGTPITIITTESLGTDLSQQINSLKVIFQA